MFLQNAATDDTNIITLREYIDFVAHVADCYLSETTQFPDDLISLLTQHHASLEPELREKVVASLVILRNKNVIDSIKYHLLISLDSLISDHFSDYSMPSFRSSLLLIVNLSVRSYSRRS